MRSVGETEAESTAEWRDFLAGLLRRDFEGEVLRLVASLVIRSAGEGGVFEVVDVELRRRVGLKVGSWKMGGWIWVCCWFGRADSGMRRKDVGSTLLSRGVGCCCCWCGAFVLGLERLRAAAAQERRVLRLDRRASS